MKNLRKNKKGFTLVEIIVVLVIIAVLAAAAIPTMIGFVEDSKGKAEIANARAAYIACQAIATEEYAVDGNVGFKSTAYTIGESTTNDDIQKKLNQMLETDLKGAKVVATESKGKVSKVVYSSVTKNSKYYEVTIEDGKAAKVEKQETSSSSNGNNGNGNGQS